ncbi:MAG: phosphotransferase, partial [Armatimonadota bacterium]
EKPWPRFHDPKSARDGLAELRGEATGEAAELLGEALELAETLADRLTDEDYRALPQTIVQGDYHPANLKFREGRVVGVFDWDWASRQPRTVDVADGLLFFCGVRDTPLVAGDIWSLTAAFTIDHARLGSFLEGYEGALPLTADERGSLPDLMRCRWLFCRVDAAIRKVAPRRRVEFVTRGLRRPLDGIDAFDAKLNRLSSIKRDTGGDE